MKDTHDYKVVVLAPEHYNTLDLIRSLGEEKLRPIYIAIKSRYKIASYSRYIKKLYNVDSIQEGYKLLLKERVPGEKVFVLTIDDKTQAYLDEHYSELCDNFYFFNCGQPNRTVLFMDKYNILKIAEEWGLPTLQSQMVDRGTIPEGLEYPVITKSSSPISGGWKSDVHICNNEEELKQAYDTIKSDKVLIQKYIDKSNECCLDGFSINSGKNVFIATETYYNYNIPGYYSPYMTSNTFIPKRFAINYRSICALFKAIGFEGIFSMEFMIDKSGNYYFSEINFRHSTWSYIATKNYMNIPFYWMASTISKNITCPIFYIKDKYTSMVEPVDYQKRVVEKRCSFFKWIHDYIHTDCKFYWNWKDPIPGLYMLFHNKTFR